MARRVLVFVYGTLKRGEPNASIMADLVTGMQRFIGTGKTVNAYPLIIASEYNIPFCLDKPGIGNRISGELYEVDEQKLEVLDEFEGHPTFYRRQPQQFQLYEADEQKLEVLDEFEGHPTFYRRQPQQVEMDHNGTTVTAWIYMLPKWTPNLLQSSSNYLETYNSNGPHNRPYIQGENCQCLDDL